MTYRRTRRYAAQRAALSARRSRAAQGGRTPRDPDDEMQPLPELRMRITIERFDAGPPTSHTFTLLRSRRIDTYRVLVDGQPWAVCGLSRVLEGLRKATPRLLSARAANI